MRLTHRGRVSVLSVRRASSLSTVRLTTACDGIPCRSDHTSPAQPQVSTTDPPPHPPSLKVKATSEGCLSLSYYTLQGHDTRFVGREHDQFSILCHWPILKVLFESVKKKKEMYLIKWFLCARLLDLWTSSVPHLRVVSVFGHIVSTISLDTTLNTRVIPHQINHWSKPHGFGSCLFLLSWKIRFQTLPVVSKLRTVVYFIIF